MANTERLVRIAAGFIYSTALLYIVPSLAAGGPLTFAHEFTAGPDGSTPWGNVVLDSAGNVYGETPFNGSTACFDTPGYGCGTVYKIDPTGALTVLVTFQGSTDGATGYGDLTLVKQTLFGEAFGATSGTFGYQGDLLFSVKTDGSNFKVLHRFNGLDGANPLERPVVTPEFALYNVTSAGGPACAPGGSYGCGVLFKLDSHGRYTILHQFTGADDGWVPGRIVMDASGTIIGTTTRGGSGNAGGTVYSYVPSTGVFTTLFTFDYTTGTAPRLGGISPDGTIYGVTSSSSAGPVQDGTIFTLKKAGTQYTMQTLFAFDYAHGAFPTAGPFVVGDGELVGTTSVGGVHQAGTLYHYLDGALTTLTSFSSRDSAPYGPHGTPAVGRSGTIYGTTQYGGTALRPSGSPCQCGAVFKWTRR